LSGFSALSVYIIVRATLTFHSDVGSLFKNLKLCDLPFEL